MEEGLVEGLFILIVFVVMIVQSVAAQKKKQRQEAERQRAQGQSGLAEMEEPADIFTKLARADAEREARDPTTEEADSSEDLTPHEIWQEIAELAGGRLSAEPTPKPTPTPAPDLHTTWEGAQLDEVEPDPREHGRMRKADFGARSTSRSTPAAAEKVPVPDRSRELAAQMGKEATSAPELQLEAVEDERGGGRMEWLFGGKDPEALRKAILLREVLGPPLALREEEEA